MFETLRVGPSRVRRLSSIPGRTGSRSRPDPIRPDPIRPVRSPDDIAVQSIIKFHKGLLLLLGFVFSPEFHLAGPCRRQSPVDKPRGLAQSSSRRRPGPVACHVVIPVRYNTVSFGVFVFFLSNVGGWLKNKSFPIIRPQVRALC